MITLHQSIIKSVLEYGSAVIGDSRKSLLKKLDAIDRYGILIAMGAFVTSPNTSIYADANLLPLEFRRDYYLITYGANVLSNSEHLLYAKMNTILTEIDNEDERVGRDNLGEQIKKLLKNIG